jgi:hypothetical protein
MRMGHGIGTPDVLAEAPEAGISLQRKADAAGRTADDEGAQMLFGSGRRMVPQLIKSPGGSERAGFAAREDSAR